MLLVEGVLITTNRRECAVNRWWMTNQFEMNARAILYAMEHEE